MNIHEVSINRIGALFTEANPTLLSVPGSNSHVPIFQNKESDNILGTVSPTTSSPSSETEQRLTKTKRKPRQKITLEIAEKIRTLAPKIESGKTTIKKAALECGINHNTLRVKLRALKSGKDLTKRKPPQKITSEIAEKIKALAPKIESGETTIEKAALEYGFNRETLRVKLQALKSGKELTRRKPRQKITSEIAEKIKALAPKIESGETTIEKAALECGINHDTLKVKLQALKNGKEPTEVKYYQKITSEIAEKIKALAPNIESGETTFKKAALECGISLKSLRDKIQALKSGKDLIKRKPQQKITFEIAEKIKALAPKIESGETTIEKAALECDVSHKTFRVKLLALKSGKELTEGKPPQKITSEIAEKIKVLAPKIESGETTIEKAALECGISYNTLQAKLQALKSGKELTKSKPPQKITPEIIEKIKALAPKIESGETTIEKAALECGISYNTLQAKLQALKSGKDLTKRKPPQKTTVEIAEKIKALAPKIERGETSITKAAQKCGIDSTTLSRKLRALKSGKDLTKRKPLQKTTSEIAEKIKALAPKIKRGETTLEKAALECDIGRVTLWGKLKALQGEKDLINSVAAEDPQVPMTPVKLPDAELLTHLSRSEYSTV